MSGLTPAWQRVLGLVGGGLLLVAGNLAIADGSALIFAGLLGFAALLVWLVATGARLSAPAVELAAEVLRCLDAPRLRNELDEVLGVDRAEPDDDLRPAPLGRGCYEHVGPAL